jgi:hypothetical protein
MTITRSATAMRMALLMSLLFLCGVQLVRAAEVYNLTGLPAYPNLASARMDQVARTDKLGRWCNRFAGATSDSLEVAESWYRRALPRASETDLNNDERYANPVKFAGIKLVVGIDYVTVFRFANQSTTIIELFKCSPAAAHLRGRAKSFMVG